MFLFTYLPQAAVLAISNGPLAAISAALLVLSESSTIFTVLSKSFLIEDALVDTFDGVLVSKNTTDLVSGGRRLKAGVQWQSWESWSRSHFRSSLEGLDQILYVPAS
jgi:hypothetical protein